MCVASPRHALTERLGEREDVGHDAVALAREHGARATEARLRLVEDEQHAARLAVPAARTHDVRKEAHLPADARERLDKGRGDARQARVGGRVLAPKTRGE